MPMLAAQIAGKDLDCFCSNQNAILAVQLPTSRTVCSAASLSNSFAPFVRMAISSTLQVLAFHAHHHAKPVLTPLFVLPATHHTLFLWAKLKGSVLPASLLALPVMVTPHTA